MSDKDDILGLAGQTRIFGDITFLMLKGAGYAAALLIGIWFLISVLAWIGRALPDESRDTPDPINRSDVVIEEVLETRAV